MTPQSIILGVIVVIALYIVYVYYFAGHGKSYLAAIHDAKTSKTFNASSLPSGNTSDFTYSVWVYVNNWNFALGETKAILVRPNMNTMEFDKTLNNVIVTMYVYPSGNGKNPVPHTCTLENVPLQAWTNIIMTVNNRTLDLYMDGKLVRTCVLPGVPVVLPGTPLNLTPAGGFSGYTGNLQYINHAINPREAWAIYREGFGGSSWFSNLLNKYRIKLAFMEDNREVNSFEI